MEVYRSKDGEVVKYIHDDGSETAIKAISKKNPELGHDPVSCNKWALFISTSVGCSVGCKFCYLTSKNFPYYYLSSLQIYFNAIEAIEAEIKARPELKRKWFKLSWMGMGDCAMKFKDMIFISKAIVTYVREHGYACGCDGVDVSSTLPKWRDSWIEEMKDLNAFLEQFPKMAINTEQRSRFRFFYSLGSTFDTVRRRELIPNTAPVIEILERILPLVQEAGIDVICHHVLLDRINDRNIDLADLEEWFSKYDYELRLLRFNKCPNSKFNPSPRFDEFVNHLKDKIKRIKYQISVGSEISAACGQFILKDMRK